MPRAGRSIGQEERIMAVRWPRRWVATVALLATGCTSLREVPPSEYLSRPERKHVRVVTRDGLEYEFDIVGSMDWENTLVVTKSRAKPLTGAVVRLPGIEFGQQIRAWLEDGTAVEPVEDLITEANRADATFEDLGALMRKVRARRLEGAPMLTPEGAPTTLGERIQERGKQMRQAAQGGATEGQAA